MIQNMLVHSFSKQIKNSLNNKNIDKIYCFYISFYQDCIVICVILRSAAVDKIAYKATEP